LVETMDNDPAHWLAALHRTHDRLAALVGTLDPDRLDDPSSCGDWTVGQLVSHLGSTAEVVGLLVDAAARGAEAPGPESFPAIWERWNAKSPRELVVDVVAADAGFIAAAEALGPAVATLSLKAFGREFDGAGLLGLRLAEQALHTWDLDVTFDPTAVVEPSAVDLLIDRVPEIAGMVGHPVAEGTEPISAVVRTSNPVRTFAVRVGEAVEVTEVEGGPGPVDLELPAEALLRLAYGRLGPDSTPAGIAGDAAGLLGRLRPVFPGI
jgi:uncharacterized protein (TIGR03083 family)